MRSPIAHFVYSLIQIKEKNLLREDYIIITRNDGEFLVLSPIYQVFEEVNGLPAYPLD